MSGIQTLNFVLFVNFNFFNVFREGAKNTPREGVAKNGGETSLSKILGGFRPTI